MAQKKISELIFETLAQKISNDPLFDIIKNDLMVQITSKHPNKSEMENLLKKVKNENSKS